jgi:hypothetical protein
MLALNSVISAARLGKNSGYFSKLGVRFDL